jgi:hypothetical protein
MNSDYVKEIEKITEKKFAKINSSRDESNFSHSAQSYTIDQANTTIIVIF